MKSLTGYRLVKRKLAGSAFDGAGARRFGGRWNSRGTPCVYLAASESLAMLEVMVHLEDYRLLRHYVLLRLSLPAALVEHLPASQLPPDWREDPAPPSTAAIGDAWLASAGSLALAVPSAVVPRELNYLLNPRHAEFAALVATAEPLDFKPDDRL